MGFELRALTPFDPPAFPAFFFAFRSSFFTSAGSFTTLRASRSGAERAEVRGVDVTAGRFAAHLIAAVLGGVAGCGVALDIGRVAPEVRRLPILVAGAHRDPAGGPLAASSAHRATEVLSLGPLTRNDAATILSTAVDRADPRFPP